MNDATVFLSPTDCPVCGSDHCVELGRLGSLMHYRCRCCGSNFEERVQRLDTVGLPVMMPADIEEMQR